jgi:hypothetical protein
MLAKRFADIDAARGQERVGHAAADDQVIDLGDEVAEHVELARDLRPPTTAATGRSGSPSAFCSAFSSASIERPA